MEKKKGIIIGAVVVVAILVIAGIAIAVSNSNSGSGVKAYEKGDKIIVATSPDFAPYDDLVGDNFSGIDMDIIRVVFYNMDLTEGKDFEFQQVTFASITLGVTQGKYTVGASGFTQTADRMNNVLFTEEYAVTNQCVVALKSNNSITADNLNTKTIAVQTGTTGATLADEYYSNSDKTNVKNLDTYSDTVANVQNGKADCIIVDHETAVGMVAKSKATSSGELEIKDIKLKGENEYYSFVLNKVNTELCMKMTTILRDMKASDDKNAVKDIIAYYENNGYASGTASYWTGHNLSDYKL